MNFIRNLVLAISIAVLVFFLYDAYKPSYIYLSSEGKLYHYYFMGSKQVKVFNTRAVDISICLVVAILAIKPIKEKSD